MTTDDMAAVHGITTAQASYAAARLIDRGYLEREERGCFSLTASGHIAAKNKMKIVSGPRGPLKGSRKPTADGIRQRAWNVMRIKRSFTLPDLLLVVATGAERNAQVSLQEFLRALRKSGHIGLTGRLVDGTRHGQRYREYQLVRNTGHYAPSLVRSETAVLDNNTGAEVEI